MKDFRAKVRTISPEIFSEINALLKKHGIDKAEVSRIWIKCNDESTLRCPPDKECHCVKTADGKVYCRCIPRVF